jgi:hypothetical protein
MATYYLKFNFNDEREEEFIMTSVNEDIDEDDYGIISFSMIQLASGDLFISSVKSSVLTFPNSLEN